MPMETLRIVESEAEASLHPRAIWNHWEKNVIWDPRTYYGVLEFIAALEIVLGFPELTRGPITYGDYGNPKILERALTASQKMFTGLIMLCGIFPIHWFSNHRAASTNLFTRSRTHILILFLLLTIVALSQAFPISPSTCEYDCDLVDAANVLLWIAILILLVAIAVVYTIARNPRKDPILAELPSPTEPESLYRPAWSAANVADGIEDDSLEPEGQVKL